MKVLQVIHAVSPKYGGPSQALAPMCRALLSRGVDVQIAGTNAAPGGHLPVEIETPTTFEGVPATFFKQMGLGTFTYSRGLARWLDQNVAEFDLVHIHGVFSHPCLSAASACRRHDVPYVVRPLGTLDPWSMKQKPLRKRLFWQVAGKRMLKEAAAVHYTAGAEQSAVEESLGLNHGRVIPLGVDADLANRVNGTEMPLPKLARLNGHPYVLVLSRLHPKKRLDVLVDAFVSLLQKQDFKDWKLVLAGEGPVEYEHALKQKVSAHQADDSVLFPGWLEGDEKNTFLQGASLLALPSHHENFGLCVVEAMACGVPVLVSPQVALAGEIEAAGAGWTSAAEVPALSRTLAEVFADESERRRRGEAGRALSRKFAWPKVAGMLEEMYESLIAGAAPNPQSEIRNSQFEI